MRKLSMLLPVSLLLFAGCNQEEATGSAELTPHVSPIVLGDMYPENSDEVDLASNERTPYEFVLLLRATGDAPVEISEACLVGPDSDMFILEGPTPATVDRSVEGALRLTYTRTEPSDSIDNVALVVQSNAQNFPTLVVPACARVVPDGEDRFGFECTSPVTVPEGTKDDTLCK